MAKSPYWPRAMREAPVLPLIPESARPTRRKALLLLPFYSKDPHGSFGKHVLTPALTMTSIAAATPEEWDISFWDENLLQGPPPMDPLPEVVGMTVHLTFAKRAYELARWYRAAGVKVVFGGLHVNGCPEECASQADAIALGEGVQTWPQILRDVDRGELQRRYDGTYRCAFADEPLPCRDILDADDYVTTASLIATRGCRNRCDFCYLATHGLRMPYRAREPRQVAADFARTGRPYGVFIDNNLGSRPDYMRALCRELAPLEKIWSAAVTVDIADDPSLVRDMAAAGCGGVFVGLETLTAANLVDANKGRVDPAEYARQVALFHDHGIQVNGSFVFGFDHDGPDVFDRTIDWIEEHRLECATFHIMTPYPGTPLFRQLEAEGRILHRDWDLYDTSHVVYRPKLMTARQLQAGYEHCYSRLFSHGSILRRRPADSSEWLPYLGMSYLYKHTNRLWPTVIRHRLTRSLWAPLINAARKRNVKNRRRFGGAVVSELPAPCLMRESPLRAA